MPSGTNNHARDQSIGACVGTIVEKMLGLIASHAHLKIIKIISCVFDCTCLEWCMQHTRSPGTHDKVYALKRSRWSNAQAGTHYTYYTQNMNRYEQITIDYFLRCLGWWLAHLVAFMEPSGCRWDLVGPCGTCGNVLLLVAGKQGHSKKNAFLEICTWEV